MRIASDIIRITLLSLTKTLKTSCAKISTALMKYITQTQTVKPEINNAIPCPRIIPLIAMLAIVMESSAIFNFLKIISTQEVPSPKSNPMPSPRKLNFTKTRPAAKKEIKLIRFAPPRKRVSAFVFSFGLTHLNNSATNANEIPMQMNKVYPPKEEDRFAEISARIRQAAGASIFTARFKRLVPLLNAAKSPPKITAIPNIQQKVTIVIVLF